VIVRVERWHVTDDGQNMDVGTKADRNASAVGGNVGMSNGLAPRDKGIDVA